MCMWQAVNVSIVAERRYIDSQEHAFCGVPRCDQYHDIFGSEIVVVVVVTCMDLDSTWRSLWTICTNCKPQSPQKCVHSEESV